MTSSSPRAILSDRDRSAEPSAVCRRSGTTTIGWAGAILALMVVCGGAFAQGAPTGAGMLRAEVAVVTLHPGKVTITAELPGRTTAAQTAEIRPQVGGIIRERLFAEGGEVAAGDVLYRIDPAPWQAAFASAEATLQKARSAVPSARSKVDRYRDLIRRNAVAQQDLDDAVAALAAAEAAVAIAEADLRSARINLDDTTIRAPIGGRIDRSSLTPGALVTAGQTTVLTTIRTIDPINVDITRSSRRLLDLRAAIADGRVRSAGEGVRVRLKLETGAVYDRTGTIAFSEANVGQTTGTYTVRASFPNPDRLLLPGMYVRAIVEEAVADNGFVVPQRAVGRNSKGEATALFVDAEDKVQSRVLRLGGAVGNGWRVDEGVADGDRIVVEGSQRARPGSSVRPVEVTIDDATGEVSPLRQGAASPPPEGGSSGSAGRAGSTAAD